MNSFRRFHNLRFSQWNALTLGFVVSLGIASSIVPQTGCSGGDGPSPGSLTLDAGTTSEAPKYTLSLTLNTDGLKIDEVAPYDELDHTVHSAIPSDPEALLWYIEDSEGKTVAGGIIEDPREAHLMTHVSGEGDVPAIKTDSATFKLAVPVNTGKIKIFQMAPNGQRAGGCNPGGTPLGDSDIPGDGGGSGGVDPSTIPGLTKVVDHGNCKSNVGILIVSDGYTQNELGSYSSQVKATVGGMTKWPTMAKHWGSFNIWSLAVASKQSGIDDPEKGTYVDTMFDMSLNVGGSRRCTLPVNPRPEGLALLAKVKKATGAKHVVILTNIKEQGGCAGSVIGMAYDNTASPTIVHELGHLLVRLDDEYVEDARCNAAHYSFLGGINVTRDPNNLPWKAITTESHEGAHYCKKGVYRPKPKCMMNEPAWINSQLIYPDFCVVCSDAFDKYFAKRPACPAPAPVKNCFEGGPACKSGTVCAWNGEASDYCCKAPFEGTKSCTTDAECGGGDNICSYGGPPKKFYYCTKADPNACQK